MPVIRRRFNYGNVLLDPSIVSDKFCVAGQTVDVRMANGELKHIHFAGFIEVDSFENHPGAVQIINVTGYCTSDDALFGHWIEYCRNTALLGCRSPAGVMLCIHRETRLPRAWCPLPALHKPN